MADNREYFTHSEDCGTVNISEEVITAIAAEAVCEVEGAALMNGAGSTEQLNGKKVSRWIHAEMKEDAITLEVCVMIRYGYAVPEIAAKVQESVSAAVSAMTGFPVRSVNVHVSGVSFN